MTSITSPVAGNGGQAAVAGAQRATSPATFATAADAVAAVQVGIASQYWDECLAYPPGDTASLWLLVDGSWRAHDNAKAVTRDMVQRAFLGTGSNVRVWYDGAKIVGLVVEGS
jgi:hypothetical protein